VTAKRAVVLGGGIAGLTAALYRSKRGGGETLLFEGSSRLGGSVKTFREDGYVLEAGPNTLLTKPASEALIQELGLEREVVIADPKAPRWIVRGARARAIKAGPAGLFTTSLSWAGKIRMGLEPFIHGRDPNLEDESVDSFFRRRFGNDAMTYAAGPFVSGVYADDPKTLSTRSATPFFSKLWEAEGAAGSVVKGLMRERRASRGLPRKPRSRTLNFTNGLEQMIEALSARITAAGATISTDARVVALEGPFAPETAPRRWRVRTSDGRVVEVDAVLSTLDAAAVARLLGDRLPRSGSRLAAMRSSPVAVVPMAWDASGGGAPVGFGALIPRHEGFRSLGVLYPSALFGGRCPAGTFTTVSFLGGALDPAIVSAPEEEIFRAAEAEVRRLHPRAGRLLAAWLARWPNAIPRIPLRHHETLGLLEEDLAALDGGRGTLHLTGAWKDGVSVSDRIARGTHYGAAL
jgi:oxygen-dependent protoporphyrinogen oxidase